MAKSSRSHANSQGASEGALARVVRLLEDRIFEEWEAGAMLPSEDSLAKEMEVSRITVREAIRTLEGRGLLRIRNGARARVEAPSGRPFGIFLENLIRRDPRHILELLEFRQAVEVHIARMAATRASRAAISAMDESIEVMRQTPGSPDEYNRADIRFHETLAGSTNNELMIMVIEQLSESLRASFDLSYRGHQLRGLPVIDSANYHQAIVERVRARDPSGAGNAMRDHLEEVGRDLTAGLQLSGQPGATDRKGQRPSPTSDAQAADEGETGRSIGLSGAEGGATE